MKPTAFIVRASKSKSMSGSENEPRRANARSTAAASSSFRTPKRSRRGGGEGGGGGRGGGGGGRVSALKPSNSHLKPSSNSTVKASKTERKSVKRAGRMVQSALACRKRDASASFASPTKAAMAKHDRRTARVHRKKRREEGAGRATGPRRKESLALSRSSLEAQQCRRSSAASTTSSLESTSSCSGSSGADNEETVRVYVRVRPMGASGEAYSGDGDGQCVAAGDDGRSVVFDRLGFGAGGSHYTFDRVFGPGSAQ